MSLQDLAKGIEVRNIAKDSHVFKEGSTGGQEMFFLFAGEVKILKNIGGLEEEINHLKPGSFFGEIGLIQNIPRTASAVVCSENAKIGVISRDHFITLSKNNPGFLVSLFRKMQERILVREEMRDLLDLQESELDRALYS
jgi:CRP-like cAMP-binding protein